jgi:cell division protein FtsI/penicillin-binding protein 2
MKTVQDLEPRARVLSLLALGLMAYLVLFGRLAYWQGIRHHDLAALARAQHDERLVLPAVRGRLLDRYGAPLVTNTPVFSIFASPDLIPTADRAQVATRVGSVLGIPPADLLAKLSTTRKFVYLKRRVPALLAHQVDALAEPGIGKVAESQRTYLDGAVPGTTLAANLLGFVNDGGQGAYGVEGYYDKQLAGRNGYEVTFRDITGRPIVLSDQKRVEPINGASLQLTIDSAIQVAAERALADGVKQYQAESGSILIMEPKTGRIVAWADVPTYDANQFGTVAAQNPRLFVDPAVSDLYEPGSVMKVVTLSGALDVHAITPDTRFNETGSVVIGGYRIKNWDNRAHGLVTMTQVLEKSLNVGAIKAEQLEGGPAFFDYLGRFGIGERAGVDLAGEANAVLGDYGTWRPVELATASFGQGIDVTPVQMLGAINVIASGGDLVWPHVVDQVIDAHGVAHPVVPRVIHHVLAPTTVTEMRQMMVGVVEHGSGYAARIEGFRGKIAGKTGTANVPEHGTYPPGEVIGSFVGFLPADHPQFTMLVIMRKPRILFEGAYVAAPIWKTVASALITQWNIAPQ